MGSWADAAATEKRIVRNVFPILNERVGRWGAAPVDAPLRRKYTWISRKKKGHIRNIAAQLRGVSSATVWGVLAGNA